MQTLNLILTIVQVLLAVVIIVVVLFQSGKSAGLSGAIGGGAETFFGKNKARSMDSMLNKVTIISAILFAIIAILTNIIQ